MEQLVSLEITKLARELGFEEYCYAWFYIYPKGTFVPKKYWQVVEILEEDEVHELIGGQHGKTISEKYRNSENQPHILARPTQAELARWLREKMDFYIGMNIFVKTNTEILYQAELVYSKLFYVQKLNFILSYEDVMEDALLKALEYLLMCKERDKLLNLQKKEAKKIL